MTDIALEAAHAAYTKTTGGILDGHPMTNAISAYLSALPGEALVVAWLVECVRGPYKGDIDVHSRDGVGGAEQARVVSYYGAPYPVVTLASLQARQARVEIAERERDAFRDMADGYGKLDAELAIAEARVKELEEALKPFARHLDEMKFDLDNHGNELPDEQTVGWVYVTNGDFRRARAALKGDHHG